MTPLTPSRLVWWTYATPNVSRLSGALIAGLLACSSFPDAGNIVVVTPSPIDIARGDSVRLEVRVVDGDGNPLTNPTIVFRAADTTVVTVSAAGWVRGRNAGTTTVIVDAGGARRGIPASVHVRPTSILLIPNSLLLSRGDTVRVTATPLDEFAQPVPAAIVSWASTHPTVASVTTSGLVRAESSGYAQIVAHMPPVSAAAFVTVRGPSAIIVAPDDTTLGQGDSAQFRASVVDQVGDPVPGIALAWETSDPTVATVSATGMAYASGAPGAALIQARYATLLGEARLVVRDTSFTRVPVPGAAFGAAISPAGVAYVTLLHERMLGRVDLPSQSLETTVPVASTPTEVAFNATGSRAYVTNQRSQSVGVVDVTTDSVIDVIPIRGDPFELIVAPGDSILYVSANTDSVFAIRLATKAVITRFATAQLANGMVINHDTLLYVSELGGNVLEWNLRTRTLARTFFVGGAPQKIARSADGELLYIANEHGYVQVWNLRSGNQDGASIALNGVGAYGIAVRPSDGLLYVTTAYFGDGRIYVIDPVRREILRTLRVGGSTRRVVFDGQGVGFVSNERGWIDFLK